MFVLAIDQGTTGSTACLLRQDGSLVAKSNKEYPQIYPKPGWVEHDPEEIWKSVETSVRQVLNDSNTNPKEIACIGITNQRETVLAWDKDSGKPLYNAIVWQCRRTTDVCNALKKRGLEKSIYKKTGLVMDPYFSGTKIQWLLKNVGAVKAQAKHGQAIAGNIDAFLLWRLTDGVSFKTDVSNASRTMLMNLKTLEWDPELLKLFQIPRSMLPEISDSSGEFGKTKGLSFLPDGIPITGIAGDQQAALFGQTCFEVGDAKCTFGTGSFLLMNTGKNIVHSKNKMLSTVAWRLKGQPATYALEGGAFICGAAVQWLRDGLRMIDRSSDVESLASQVNSSEGVTLVPAFVGLGAPHWNSEARGLITGMTRGTTRAHIAFATLEAMALQNTDILNAMQGDLKKKMKTLKVDGGASANDMLMQMQANFNKAKVMRPKQVETTAIGAAYLAGLGAGVWASLPDLKKVWKVDREFAPQKFDKTVVDRWKVAVKKA